MTDLNATTRKLRKDRKLAVKNFALALGFHEEEIPFIRDITVRSREVVVHKYQTYVDVDRKVKQVEDSEGNKTMIEVTLFTHEKDIDNEETVAQAVGLVETKPGASFGVK